MRFCGSRTGIPCGEVLGAGCRREVGVDWRWRIGAVCCLDSHNDGSGKGLIGRERCTEYTAPRSSVVLQVYTTGTHSWSVKLLGFDDSRITIYHHPESILAASMVYNLCPTLALPTK